MVESATKSAREERARERRERERGESAREERARQRARESEIARERERGETVVRKCKGQEERAQETLLSALISWLFPLDPCTSLPPSLLLFVRSHFLALSSASHSLSLLCHSLSSLDLFVRSHFLK